MKSITLFVLLLSLQLGVRADVKNIALGVNEAV